MIRRILNVFRDARVARDIEREMDFHLAEREDDLIRAGMPADAARREARRRFGRETALRERTRDSDVAVGLESLLRDVRYAARSLGASRAFTAVAVLSLALGIGANTAIFSLINAVMLRDLPVREPERLALVVVEQTKFSPFTNPLWEQVRDHQDAFESVLAYGDARFELASSGESRRSNGYWVSGSFFTTLGVGATRGRTILPADDTPGCPAVIAISQAYWQGALGADPRAVGRTLMFDGHPVEIVGVVDGRFTGLERGRSPEFYIPLCAEATLNPTGGFLAHRSWWFLQVVGRLRDGESNDVVSARLARTSPAWFAATLPPNWSSENQKEYLARSLRSEPSLDALSELRGRYSGALFVLMGIVAVVLLIACANVANLMLARAAVRRREFAVRVALGAGRGRLVRQLLVEGLLLSALGGTAGIALAIWGSRGVVALISSSRERVSLDLGVDLPVLAFTVAVAIGTALLFAMAPAWRAARVDPQSALVAQGRGVVDGHPRLGVGKALVALQVAMSLVLVTCAALLLGSFRSVATIDAGFVSEGVLVADTDLRIDGQQRGTYDVTRQRVLERLRALPGVTHVSAAYTTPLGYRMWNDLVQVAGRSMSPEESETYINLVDDGYFAAMGMRMVQGRDVRATDGPSTPMVAVINETAARRFFPGRDAVGQVFTLKRGNGASPPYEVVGVVSDAKYNSLRDAAPATAFFAMHQDTSFSGPVSFVLRARVPLASMHAAVASAVTEVAPRATVQLRPLAVQLADAMGRERLLAALSGFFGALALLLAMIGLYGTMAYTVARRRSEIGLRLALGAARSRVLRDVLRDVLKVLVVGMTLGLAGVLASTRMVQGFLYGVTPRDPATIAVSAAVLLLVALAAGFIPARRASRMDPMDSLRND